MSEQTSHGVYAQGFRDYITDRESALDVIIAMKDKRVSYSMDQINYVNGWMEANSHPELRRKRTKGHSPYTDRTPYQP